MQPQKATSRPAFRPLSSSHSRLVLHERYTYTSAAETHQSPTMRHSDAVAGLQSLSSPQCLHDRCVRRLSRTICKLISHTERTHPSRVCASVRVLRKERRMTHENHTILRRRQNRPPPRPLHNARSSREIRHFTLSSYASCPFRPLLQPRPAIGKLIRHVVSCHCDRHKHIYVRIARSNRKVCSVLSTSPARSLDRHCIPQTFHLSCGVRRNNRTTRSLPSLAWISKHPAHMRR